MYSFKKKRAITHLCVAVVAETYSNTKTETTVCYRCSPPTCCAYSKPSDSTTFAAGPRACWASSPRLCSRRRPKRQRPCSSPADCQFYSPTGQSEPWLGELICGSSCGSRMRRRLDPPTTGWRGSGSADGSAAAARGIRARIWWTWLVSCSCGW